MSEKYSTKSKAGIIIDNLHSIVEEYESKLLHYKNKINQKDIVIKDLKNQIKDLRSGR